MTEHQIKTRKITFDNRSHGLTAEPLVVDANDYSDIVLHRVAKKGVQLYDTTITISYSGIWSVQKNEYQWNDPSGSLAFHLTFHFLTPELRGSQDIADFLYAEYIRANRTLDSTIEVTGWVSNSTDRWIVTDARSVELPDPERGSLIPAFVCQGVSSSFTFVTNSTPTTTFPLSMWLETWNYGAGIPRFTPQSSDLTKKIRQFPLFSFDS